MCCRKKHSNRPRFSTIGREAGWARQVVPLTLCLASTLLLAGCDRSVGTGKAAGQSARPAEPLSKGDAAAQTGHRLINQREFAEALPHLRRALGQRLAEYAKSDVLTMIGNCHYELGQLDEALKFHDKAIAEDPRNHKAHVNKGVVYRLMGSYDQAAECYSTALRLAPGYAELHGSLGTLAMFQGNYDEAIKSLERAIELDDSHPVAHANLALAYASVGRFNDADDQLKKAVLRGYHQPEIVKDRVEKLREIAESGKEQLQR